MAADERFSEEYLRAGDDDPPLGVRNEIITGPVSDWATDFSHLEPEWADLLNRLVTAFGPAVIPTQTGTTQ